LPVSVKSTPILQCYFSIISVLW